MTRASRRAHKNHAEFIGFPCGFKHNKIFEAISKHRPLTALQPQALFENSPKEIDVFLAEK